jgi:type 1 glutamine amidotransferase|tara:strand:+ start:339 stop:1307 length:969 start_codon:yes stop_codon:yes gene_type:complete
LGPWIGSSTFVSQRGWTGGRKKKEAQAVGLVEFMKNSLFLAILPVLALGLFAANDKKQSEAELVEASMPKIEAPKKKHEILCFSKPYGFRHGSIEIGETMLKVMGEKTGLFNVTFSEDLSNFEPENIKKFDAICFNNNTHIQKGLKEEGQRAALISYVKNGGGVFAIHSATDGGWPEYTEMIGGNFNGHPWGAGGTWDIANEDPGHAIVKEVHGGKGFKLKDELYLYKDFDRSKQRVLMSLDMNSEANGKRKGSRKDNDYALAWVKEYGKGRVFVSAFGHNKEVFHNPEILKMWVEGFRYILGESEVETASMKKPEFNQPKK